MKAPLVPLFRESGLNAESLRSGWSATFEDSLRLFALTIEVVNCGEVLWTLKRLINGDVQARAPASDDDEKVGFTLRIDRSTHRRDENGGSDDGGVGSDSDENGGAFPSGEREEGEVEEVGNNEEAGGGHYELLVDYEFIAAGERRYVERDKWSTAATFLESVEVFCGQMPASEGITVSFALRIHELLAPFDLSTLSKYRKFRILSSNNLHFYVNTAALNLLGGELFASWYAKECEGEEAVVAVQSMDSGDLTLLLEACTGYSTVLVHRANFHHLLRLAERERIVGLLRYVENFLLESDGLHKMRKMEYAIEYKMARLADSVLRSFSSRVDRLDCLFDYLNANNERLDSVHPDILSLFEVYDSHVVL